MRGMPLTLYSQTVTTYGDYTEFKPTKNTDGLFAEIDRDLTRIFGG